MVSRLRIALPGLLVLGAALLLLGPTPPMAAGPAGTDGISGAGASGVQIVNLDPDEAAEVSIDFFSQSGRPPVTLQRTLPAQGVASVYLPSEAALRPGAYSAIARSDRPIDLLVRHDWPASGGAVIENRVGIGTELILPWAAKDYFGQTSVILLQNTNTLAAANATLTYFMGAQGATVADMSLNLQPGTSASIDMGKHPSLESIPTGSLGWMRLTSDQPMALSSIVDLATSEKGVYSVEGGPPAEMSGTRLSAALVANAFVGATGAVSQTTGISVLNPGDQETSVLLRYSGAAGSCAGLALQHGPFDVPAKGMLVFYQGNVAAVPTGDSGLPAGCAASALIEADAPVVAVINSTSPLGDSTAAALARPIDQGATRVALPTLRRRHTNLAFSSLVLVHNPGQQPAQASLQLTLWNGGAVNCSPDCERSIPAGGSTLWNLDTLAGVPDNSFGSAWIVSDQPVLATVLETSVLDATMYNGVPDRRIQEGEAAKVRAVPLLRRNSGDGQPIPTRTAGPTAVPGTATVPSTPVPQPARSLRGYLASTGVQVLNAGEGPADVALRLQRLNGGGATQVDAPALPAGVAANFYLPTLPNLPNAAHAGLALAADQPIDAVFRTDWNALGKAVLGRAPTADTHLIVPLVARYDTITSSYVFIQNSDVDHEAMVTLDLHVFEGQRLGRRQLALTLAPGAATMVDMSRHPALQDLIEERTSWTGWIRLTSDRPVAAMALADLERSAGAYVVAGLGTADIGATLAAPMLFRHWLENADATAGGILDSAIHVVNPNDQPVTVTVRYRVAAGGPAACPAGQEIVHGGQLQTLAPGAMGLYHQHLLIGPDSGLPQGCAASAMIEASAPVAATVDIGNESGLVAAYPAEPVDLARSTLHLTMVRREHTNLMLTTLIQVQNPGTQSVTATLRVFTSNGTEMDCPSGCQVSLGAGASHTWDPRQLENWTPNSYGSARIEADGPLTAIVLDASTNQMVDLAAYAALRDDGRQKAPLPMLFRGVSLASLPQPDLEPATPPLLGMSMRPPTAEGDRLTTQVDLRCGSKALRRAVLRFIYDASWLRFDETDADGDSVPDAVAITLPAGAKLAVAHERSGGEGRLTVTIDASPTGPMSGALRMAVTLRQTGVPGEGAFGFGIDPKNGAELTGSDGRAIPPEIGGMGWRPGAYHEAYLPALAISRSMAGR